MKILLKFLQFRVLGFKTEEFGVSIKRKQKVLPMTDLFVMRGFGYGLSLSQWD